MRGQFQDQPFGQRAENIVVIVLRRGGLAANGDDGPLRRMRGRFVLAVRRFVALVRSGIGRLVFRADIAATTDSAPSASMLTKAPARAMSAGS